MFVSHNVRDVGNYAIVLWAIGSCRAICSVVVGAVTFTFQLATLSPSPLLTASKLPVRFVLIELAGNDLFA